MAQMLLVNPRKRRKARRASPAKRRRNPISAASTLGLARRRRRRNPIAAVSRRRRRNPISAVSRVMRRRRRNPIAVGLSPKVIVAMLKDGLIGGAGAVGMDVLMGQVNKYLPITFQTVPGLPGVGDGVKALLTAIIGQGLDKRTKGLSRKAAEGALAAQAAGIIRALLPDSVPLGYYTPAQLVQGSARMGPIRPGMNGMRRYLPQSGKTPLLSAYMQSGQSPLLSRAASTAENEGFRYR